MTQTGKRDVALQTGSQQASRPGPQAQAYKTTALKPNRKDIALAGEKAALKHLLSEGYKLLHTNWRSGRFGEIDLVVQALDGTIVFVEVKTRRRAIQQRYGDTGFDAINWSKRRKIIICARSYLARNYISMATASCRIDVLVVYYGAACLSDAGPGLQDVSVLHIANAFDASE